MQSYTLLGVAVITTVLSQLLFKKGMIVVGSMNFSMSNLLSLVGLVLKNSYLLTGLFFYGVAFLLWLMVLSRMQLSIAYPITSLNFVLVLLASYYLFGERLSHIQTGGILLIIIGVIALSATKV